MTTDTTSIESFCLELDSDPSEGVSSVRLADLFATNFLARAPDLKPLAEDVIQEARLGLFTARRQFNANLGLSFGSFAVATMKGRIDHFLERMRKAGTPAKKRTFADFWPN